MRAWFPFALVLTCSLTAPSQSVPAASPPDSAPTLKVDVKLVPVHVVVRDAQGQTVGNLGQDNFQVFDQGKEQVITQFSVEEASKGTAHAPAQSGEVPGAVAPLARFTAYLFDDLHLEHNDLVQSREAADRQLASLSPRAERAAIFTTSGRKGVDFTADRAKLHDILANLEPQGKAMASDCPTMSYYMADLIANKGDADALQVASDDALACAFDGNKKFKKAAQQMASSAAREKTATGRVETLASLRILKALVQGMSKAPGQRIIVVVSPGFFIPEDLEQVEIMDLAVRSDVTISALDPRGLVPPFVIRTGKLDPQKMSYKTLSDNEESAVLDELADATGGVFFHNNNDVNEGFRRVAARPEYSYVLGFSPQDMKFDGRFHKLKVTVKSGSKLTVLARKGYYAPKKKP